MTGRPDSIASDEAWEIVDLPRTTGPPSNNAFIDFQLNSRFGNLSMQVLPSTATASSTETSRRMSGYQQEQSPLFRLPTELRLQIYEMVLYLPTTDSGLTLVRTGARKSKATVLALLLTCRRVLEEAEGIFYSINRLRITLPLFWHTIGQKRKYSIAMISLLAISAAATLIDLRTLRHFAPNLRSIHIVRQSSARFINPSSWRLMAPQLVSELKGFTSLESVQTRTPQIFNPTSEELVRKAKLEEVDVELRDAASAKGKGPAPGDGVRSKLVEHH